MIRIPTKEQLDVIRAGVKGATPEHQEGLEIVLEAAAAFEGMVRSRDEWRVTAKHRAELSDEAVQQRQYAQEELAGLGVNLEAMRSNFEREQKRADEWTQARRELSLQRDSEVAEYGRRIAELEDALKAAQSDGAELRKALGEHQAALAEANAEVYRLREQLETDRGRTEQDLAGAIAAGEAAQLCACGHHPYRCGESDEDGEQVSVYGEGRAPEPSDEHWPRNTVSAGAQLCVCGLDMRGCTDARAELSESPAAAAEQRPRNAVSTEDPQPIIAYCERARPNFSGVPIALVECRGCYCLLQSGRSVCARCSRFGFPTEADRLPDAMRKSVT